jgi:hypothetical protein
LEAKLSTRRICGLVIPCRTYDSGLRASGIPSRFRTGERSLLRNEIRGIHAQGFHWRTNVATYRYEDVIFKKRIWIDDLCSWFGWDISSDLKGSVAARFDVVVDVERPDQHIRQVKPGNHRRHLRKETIDDSDNASRSVFCLTRTVP